MRIALLPIDNRPINYQFPLDLARIAGIKLLVPPRDMLGSLHRSANRDELLTWLLDTIPNCDAALFSWDALVYGGLIQSRRIETEPADIGSIAAKLKAIDWKKLAGYSYSVVPRLGISVTTEAELEEHEQAISTLSGESGTEYEELIRKRMELRKRNLHINKEAVRWSASLGLRRLHIGVEDNAQRGPHLEEMKSLRGEFYNFKSLGCTFTIFDGTDECPALLLAAAHTEHTKPGKLPINLMVHPKVPGADRYTGRFESHSLGEGLTFLEGFLGFNYSYEGAEVNWLVIHGVQPQPDLFEKQADMVFSSHFLLPPKEMLGIKDPLFVTDLAACNGGNPNLLAYLAAACKQRLHGIVACNTNFNSLGISAALIRLANSDPDQKALRDFMLKRIADDYVYQSLTRWQVRHFLRGVEADSITLEGLDSIRSQACLNRVRTGWKEWLADGGHALLTNLGISPGLASTLQFSFPWNRPFEIECEITKPGAAIQ